MRKTVNVFVLILIVAFKGLGSDQQLIDSLKIELLKTDNEKRKVDLLIKIGTLYSISDFERSKEYLQEALEESIMINYKLGVADAYFYTAKAYASNKLSEEAIDFFRKSIEAYKKLNDNDRIASINNNIGIIYKNNDQYEDALEYFNAAESIAKIIENDELLTAIYNNKGSVYRHIGKYDRAIEYYLESQKIKEKLGDKKGIAIIYGNLGNLYCNQNSFGKAIEYHTKAKDLFETLNDHLLVGHALFNLGSVYKIMKENHKALETNDKALEIFEKLEFNYGKATCLVNNARIYRELQDFNKAIENSKKALAIFKNQGNKASESGAFIEIGTAYIQLEKFKQGKIYLDSGLVLANDIGNKQREIDGYEGLYLYYRAMGNYRKALDYYVKYSELKDELFNTEKNKQIAEITAAFELDKKEKENEILNQKYIRKETENKALIGGIVFFLVFAIYFYQTTQQKKRTNRLLSDQNQEINQKQQQIIAINERLQKSRNQLRDLNIELKKLNQDLEKTVEERTAKLRQSNKELDTFLYQSSHAFRRPIVNILGLIQIARLEPNPNNIPNIYCKIDDTASKMDRMLKKLVMVSEVNLAEPRKDHFNVHQLVGEVLAHLGPSLLSTTINFEKEISKDLIINTDKRLLNIILQNVLENAIIFKCDCKERKPGIKIAISNHQDDKNIHVNIMDNGIGIPKEAQSEVFDMFSVASNRSKGYGLGLYITKKAIEKLNGEIIIESKEDKFTHIEIIIPS